jgi:hypothetical protein
MRLSGRVVLLSRDFVRRDDVLSPGGQIHSVEAAFSPRGSDGEPMPLFDRRTGALDPTVVGRWRQFDVRLRLEEQWSRIGPLLSGKLHVYGGGRDQFYLDGAVALLAQSLSNVGSDADIRIVEGAGHQHVREAFESMRRVIGSETTAR